MLVYEMAITPDAFDGEIIGENDDLRHELRELLEELVIYSRPANVMVANLHKDKWYTLAEARINHGDTLREPHRGNLLALLSRLKDSGRLVRHPKRMQQIPNDDRDWLRSALEADHLDWIVVGQPALKASCPEAARTVLLAGLRQQEQWKGRPTSALVPMCPSGYEAVLRSLLRHAKKAKLIDPYLSWCDRQHFEIVEIVARLMGPPGSEGMIEIHTKQDMPVEKDLAGWERKVPEMKRVLRSRHKFRVCLWRQKDGRPLMDEPLGRRVHNRYLLTNQWGVFLGTGFDCYKEGTEQRDDWHLMPELHRRRVWWEFHADDNDGTDPKTPFRADTKSPFELVGSIKIE
jgi:hypothetical protein